MDETEFRAYLKKSGKQAHVVDGLVGQVQRFAAYLAKERGQSLESAAVPDLLAYAQALEAARPGSARTQVRGLGLYYRFCGRSELAEAANALREAGIARHRVALKLAEFLGMVPADLEALARAGIRTTDQMLGAGRTPESRRELAGQTGLALEKILELVCLSDLARLPGVKGIRARLYYEAGVHTPLELASWEVEALLAETAAFVARTGFPGTAPLPQEVRSTIATARTLPRVVEY